MRLWWPLAASLVLSVPVSATTTPRQDSVTVTVATRRGTLLGSVRMPRAASMVLTTWHALPLDGTWPSASTLSFTSAEWTSADIGNASTVEVRLAIDTLAIGNRILVRVGTLVRPIMLAMPTTTVPSAPNAATPSRAITPPAAGRPDSLPQWVRAARESFTTPVRLSPPASPAAAVPPKVSPTQPAVRPPQVVKAPAASVDRTERTEQPSRGLTASRPTEPDVAPTPSRTERYDLGDLVRPASAARRVPPPSDEATDAESATRLSQQSKPARQAPEVSDAPQPQAFLRLSYLDAPRYLVLAVERPFTRAFSASLESSRALGTQLPTATAKSIVSLGARWYLMAQRRTPYLFGDVGVAWADSTKVARHGAGLGVLWPVGGFMDLDVAVRAWGQMGPVTEPTRWTAGVRLHFEREE